MDSMDILLKNKGERARYLRKKKNMSVEQLSALSGIPVKQIRKLENNEDVRVDVITAVAITLGISPNKLASGVNEPEKSTPDLSGGGILS